MILFQRISPFRKRGEPLNTPKRQNIKKLSKNTHPTQKILRAIKTAEAEDQLDSQSILMSTLIEDLGLVIGVIRRQKDLSIDELGIRINIPSEVLLALETGILPCLQVCEILPSLLAGMDISLKKIAKGIEKENTAT